MSLLEKDCRHGKFYYAGTDELVGYSLDTYGEFSEFEVEVFRKTLRPGDTVIDVGANIGAFTIPMAKLVGPDGAVIAFEPGKTNAEILRKNVAANGLDNVVEVFEEAASNKKGFIPVSYDWPSEHYPKVGRTTDGPTVRTMTIDSLELAKCKFIKVDVDGHELEVLKGATETIRRCQPMIFIENEHRDKGPDLVGYLVEELGYRCYWFRPPLYNPSNFFKVEKNIFPSIVSLMMICVPEDSEIEIAGCDEVSDIRNDDRMFDREIERYKKRIERKPDDLMSRLLVGHYSNLMQREDEAYAAFNENLRRDPNHVPTKAILGMMRLQRGDWTAWPEYELRYLQPNKKQFGGDRKFDVPQWDGTPTQEPVLIWCEQGFGDSIMFARFLKHARRLAPNCFLEVQPQLFELFDYSLVSPRGLYRKGRCLPEYKFQCSLPSLPAVLGADADMMQIDYPYLFAEPMMAQLWKNKGHPKIGICDRGSFLSERPYTRDLPLTISSPFMRKVGPFLSLVQDGQYESFADTAAAIESLDLVITVDTSVYHLAGAMGKDVWLLLSFDPDWRHQLHGSSTIWYPTARIFRQPRFRDWQSVVRELEVAYKERENAKEIDASRGKETAFLRPSHGDISLAS
jgi:FkbM family methyltransferase